MINIVNTDIQKRIRKRRRRFKAFFLIILISVIIIFLFNTPVFKVKRIAVKGNNIVQAQEITELSGVEIGQNLLKINIRQANENILTNSYIETSKVERTLLGTVNIIVKERQGAGIAQFGDKYVTIDKNGIVIEILDKKDKINLLTILGLNIKEAKPGKKLELWDSRKLYAFNIIFDNITNDDLSGIINEVDINNLLSIILRTKENINIKIGDIENIKYKLKVSKAIMEKDVLEKGLKGTIDVSFNGNPVFRKD